MLRDMINARTLHLTNESIDMHFIKHFTNAKWLKKVKLLYVIDDSLGTAWLHEWAKETLK